MSDEYDIYRETIEVPLDGAPLQIRPYGFLEGFTLKFEQPLENMDANRPYFVKVTLQRYPHEWVETPFAIQQICRTVGGKFRDGDHRGQEPIL